MKQEEFVKGLTYLGLAYGKEFTQLETKQIYDFLKQYNYETFTKAIKNIIKTSKFIPKIADLIEECENCKSTTKIEVIEFMKDSGYFKLGLIRSNGEQIMLSDEHASRNYLKAITMIERGIVPDWFQEDINYYYGIMKQEKLAGSSKVLLS